MRGHLGFWSVVAALSCLGAACDSGTSAAPTTIAAKGAELIRLHEARDRWNEANIATYRMTLTFTGHIGIVECRYEIDNGVSALAEGPFRHVADTTVEALDESAAAACGEFAILQDVYEHLEEVVQETDELFTASVAYDFQGVPVFIQYGGSPSADGGGSLTVSVSPWSA